MPKNSYPFVYLNIKMNPNNVDVNIHPSKHEVRYLYQDEIINKIQDCIEKQLMNSNLSRTYCVKNLTIDTFLPSSNCTLKESTENESTIAVGKSPIVYPYQLTRVDSRERTLDSYKHRTSISSPQILTSQSKLANKPEVDENEVEKSPFRYQNQERVVQLKSLNELRDEVELGASVKARNFLKEMSFVGCIENELALVQYKTGLYLLNTKVLSQELFYQIALFNFANFGYFRFEEPILIKDLACIALDDPESCWSPEDGDKQKLASKCAKLLSSKAQMLDDYFSIKINGKGDEALLEAVPILLVDCEPEILDLPMFILRLSTEVNWGEEKNCFKSICSELGIFYAVKSNQEGSDTQTDSKPDKKWLLEHVIYQYFRKSLLPSIKNEDLFFKLVDLHDLYKVFERC
jgi:DNA mismatch repair protein MLH1